MVRGFKNADVFLKNIIIVFIGNSLANFFNLLYQLLIAHRLSPANFAAFNSLLAIFVLASTPLATLQTVVAKYTAEFNAENKIDKIRFLLSNLFKKSLGFSVVTLVIGYSFSFYIIDKLKINSVYSGHILVLLLAVSWVLPVFMGGLQGLELFKWMTSVSVAGGLVKLILAFIFVWLGFSIAGALGALLFSILITLAMAALALKNFFSLNVAPQDINFKEIFIYLFPVTVSIFCLTVLTNLDMVVVRRYFSPEDSGSYSLALMVGKIFLFLPAAISLVMFPRSSGLNAKQMDTIPVLNRSLLYAAILCILAIFVYNALPALVLRILTGKALAESITLGRLFSISMSFFTLLYIIINYFLSISDLRFIKYLVLFSGLQVLAIILFHRSLMQIQMILCANAILLFLINLGLANFKRR